ncbi:hypothetical protein L6164_007362 [Bauhinia variegata]|uniref:Uncharacterized protein n=1 Tax=Bauhinia variegata TaxID=167791 RepID=A0ACB9PDA8_BAUVA|nr:hypothetical protein L6164_007362 [Bauhinia variegata]
MAFGVCCRDLFTYATLLVSFVVGSNAIDVFLEWNVALEDSDNIRPVIVINGMFPGPLINVTTNDVVHVNVFNNMDEPLLFTWHGIQQRLNSWQDGVSGTNCPILPGTNWTYVFQVKDQIGSFFYYPSINFQKAAGGFGPIRVNNRDVIAVPFPKPEAEFDLLIGDWSYDDYKRTRSMLGTHQMTNVGISNVILMNGKGPYGHPLSKASESFTVTRGKTYRFRISNVGNALSFNFKIQNHLMVLVETEGSYTNQITLDSLDVHIGQSYSVLVTMNQDEADYYIIAAAKLIPLVFGQSFAGVGILHYSNSDARVTGPLPIGPHPYDLEFSVNQAKSVRWNLTTGAARPNPQGSFNIQNVTLSQTFILQGSMEEIQGLPRYTVNNVSYYTVDTPLKLADNFGNGGSGVYQLDAFPLDSVNDKAAYGISVVTGTHRGWAEFVFKNNMDVIDSWHLDGYGFFVVGFGKGDWTPDLRKTSYNLFDPVVRSTVQVYPRGWTAVYAFLDNPGMWNLRSQLLKHWYLGQELYIRVHDDDPDPAKERPPPDNLLLCGIFDHSKAPANSPVPFPAP